MFKHDMPDNCCMPQRRILIGEVSLEPGRLTAIVLDRAAFSEPAVPSGEVRAGGLAPEREPLTHREADPGERGEQRERLDEEGDIDEEDADPAEHDEQEGEEGHGRSGLEETRSRHRNQPLSVWCLNTTLERSFCTWEFAGNCDAHHTLSADRATVTRRAESARERANRRGGRRGEW